MCRDRNIALASHDDATHDHVRESHQLGSVIAEFPTTFEAAEASRRRHERADGRANIVRGGSHSGNVAAKAGLPPLVCWISFIRLLPRQPAGCGIPGCRRREQHLYAAAGDSDW